MTDFDVIVLGSGIGGLTCASRLAQLGFKVGVFEKHIIPGGYATNFRRCGYTFDVSLHAIGGLDPTGNTHNILKYCGVLDKITPIKKEMAFGVEYKNQIISIPNHKDDYKKLLIDLFPYEKNSIHQLFRAIEKFARGFEKFILNPDTSLFQKLNSDCLTFIQWSEKTTEQVIRKYIHNEDFIYLFTALWPYYGLPPKQLSALYFFIPWISYHMHGTYYLEGGSQKLSNTMVEIIKEKGGAVYLNTEIESIICEQGKVKSVSLKDGKSFTASSFVSNINPQTTLKLTKQYTYPEKYKKKVYDPSIGCSLSQLYIALDCHPSLLNIPDEEIFYGDGMSAEENYAYSLNAQYEKCGFVLTNYSHADPSLNAPDKGVITLTILDDYAYWSTNQETYKKQKEYLTQLLLERLEEKFPQIKEHIVLTELGTPRTMERYTNNPKGAVYGYAQTVKQAGRHRLSHQTPLPNLLLVGAWVNPGGGYEGSISSGMMVAQALAKSLNTNNSSIGT